MQTEQLELTERALARATDPETSHEAAKSVLATKLEGLVLTALKMSPGGLTNHELVESTHLNWNTVTPRVRPLVRKGLVIDSGVRRKGPAGKNCVVWRAV